VTADMLGQALARGWHVFPCLPGDKRPAVDRWEQRASADPGHIVDAWSSRYAGHNIGVACGPSGLVVIDLDTHGQLPAEWQLPGIKDGRDVLAQLCEWAGQDWPATYAVATPSGGLHLYFRAPAGQEIRNSAGRLGPLVDVRARGGYVVGPGSVVGGRGYELQDDAPPVPLPGWLCRLLEPQPAASPAAASGRPAPGRLAALARAVETAADGQLNNTLHWAACRAAEMIAAGEADASDATAALLAAAVLAGHPERPAARTIESGLKGGAR
jgi:Bifunctional DNA primase/polymerase, N-terminal